MACLCIANCFTGNLQLILSGWFIQSGRTARAGRWRPTAPTCDTNWTPSCAPPSHATLPDAPSGELLAACPAFSALVRARLPTTRRRPTRPCACPPPSLRPPAGPRWRPCLWRATWSIMRRYNRHCPSSSPTAPACWAPAASRWPTPRGTRPQSWLSSGCQPAAAGAGGQPAAGAATCPHLAVGVVSNVEGLQWLTPPAAAPPLPPGLTHFSAKMKAARGPLQPLAGTRVLRWAAQWAVAAAAAAAVVAALLLGTGQ